ncbi:unnamed protein product [Trifolium pratense]|uniref:Uncharacterized protein n=1 Tax=Trifolium pratense TaxID=57577 RepID=A0ACB0JG75_TRIPR|nr:unnamed protein product [Trifolium pratense]
MQVSNIRGCHLTAGFYKLNVDSAGPSGQGKWGLATVIQDADGLVSAVGCWCLPILPYSNVAEAFEKVWRLQGICYFYLFRQDLTIVT